MSLDCGGNTTNVSDGRFNVLSALTCNNVVVNQRSSVGFELFLSYALSMPDKYEAVKDGNMMEILTYSIIRSFTVGSKAWACAPCLFTRIHLRLRQ